MMFCLAKCRVSCLGMLAAGSFISRCCIYSTDNVDCLKASHGQSSSASTVSRLDGVDEGAPVVSELPAWFGYSPYNLVVDPFMTFPYNIQQPQAAFYQQPQAAFYHQQQAVWFLAPDLFNSWQLSLDQLEALALGCDYGRIQSAGYRYQDPAIMPHYGNTAQQWGLLKVDLDAFERQIFLYYCTNDDLFRETMSFYMKRVDFLVSYFFARGEQDMRPFADRFAQSERASAMLGAILTTAKKVCKNRDGVDMESFAEEHARHGNRTSASTTPARLTLNLEKYATGERRMGRSGTGEPLLVMAARRGLTGVVKLLLLMISSKVDSSVLIKMSEAARPEVRSSAIDAVCLRRKGLGQTALMAAAQNGHVDTVKILLDFGAHVFMQCGVLGFTALMYALEPMRRLNVYSLATDRRQARNDNYWKERHFAAYVIRKKADYLQIIELLLAKASSEAARPQSDETSSPTVFAQLLRSNAKGLDKRSVLEAQAGPTFGGIINASYFLEWQSLLAAREEESPREKQEQQRITRTADTSSVNHQGVQMNHDEDQDERGNSQSQTDSPMSPTSWSDSPMSTLATLPANLDPYYNRKAQVELSDSDMVELSPWSTASHGFVTGSFSLRGYNALMLAVERRNLAAVRLMLRSMATETVFGDHLENSTSNELRYSKNRKLAIFKILNHKSDVSTGAWTALTLAAYHRCPEIVQALLDFATDVIRQHPEVEVKDEDPECSSCLVDFLSAESSIVPLASPLLDVHEQEKQRRDLERQHVHFRGGTALTIALDWSPYVRRANRGMISWRSSAFDAMTSGSPCQVGHLEDMRGNTVAVAAGRWSGGCRAVKVDRRVEWAQEVKASVDMVRAIAQAAGALHPIPKGVVVDKRRLDGLTPVMCAIAVGDHLLTQTLLDAGADVQQRTPCRPEKDSLAGAPYPHDYDGLDYDGPDPTKWRISPWLWRDRESLQTKSLEGLTVTMLAFRMWGYFSAADSQSLDNVDYRSCRVSGSIFISSATGEDGKYIPEAESDDSARGKIAQLLANHHHVDPNDVDRCVAAPTQTRALLPNDEKNQEWTRNESVLVVVLRNFKKDHPPASRTFEEVANWIIHRWGPKGFAPETLQKAFSYASNTLASVERESAGFPVLRESRRIPLERLTRIRDRLKNLLEKAQRARSFLLSRMPMLAYRSSVSKSNSSSQRANPDLVRIVKAFSEIAD